MSGLVLWMLKLVAWLVIEAENAWLVFTFFIDDFELVAWGSTTFPTREKLNPLNLNTVLSQPSLALSIVRHRTLQA